VKEIQLIVREADTDMENPPATSITLDILAKGYRLICKDDCESLEKEFYLYDALYAYFKKKMEGKAKYL